MEITQRGKEQVNTFEFLWGCRQFIQQWRAAGRPEEEGQKKLVARIALKIAGRTDNPPSPEELKQFVDDYVIEINQAAAQSLKIQMLMDRLLVELAEFHKSVLTKIANNPQARQTAHLDAGERMVQEHIERLVEGGMARPEAARYTLVAQQLMERIFDSAVDELDARIEEFLLKSPAGAAIH